MTEKQVEALEKLNQGIQESRRTVQQQTMELAQDYFVNSAVALKDLIKENRAALESLPDQIPGGREEAFQAMFQELMDNYSNIEGCVEEAQQNVSNLNPDQIRRQEEVDATDAARREARERGVDLTKIKGTGSDGRIIVTDVVEAAEAMEAGVGGEGSVISGDGAAGQVAGQAQEAAGGAAQQAQDTAGQVTDQAGQVAGQAQQAVGGLTGDQQQGGQGGGGPLGGVTDQVGQVAGQAQQAAGQVTDQAGQVAGQAQEAAGGAAQQAQDTAGQAAQQGQEAAGQVAQQGQQAAGQAAQQAGGGQQQPNATQAAQQKAQQLGVDISQVQGSGAGGRVTVRDVQQAANQQ
jgi:pyruvate/2-oxoglutarate dehydrogenase complex dihydrolipoamide acyltransferase (E2) component